MPWEKQKEKVEDVRIAVEQDIYLHSVPENEKGLKGIGREVEKYVVVRRLTKGKLE